MPPRWALWEVAWPVWLPRWRWSIAVARLNSLNRDESWGDGLVRMSIARQARALTIASTWPWAAAPIFSISADAQTFLICSAAIVSCTSLDPMAGGQTFVQPL